MNILIDYLAGELSEEEQQVVEQQIADSPEWQRELEYLSGIYQDLQSLPDREPSNNLRDGFSSMLASAIEAEKKSGQIIRLSTYRWIGRVAAAAIILTFGIFIGQKWSLYQLQQDRVAMLEHELYRTKLDMENLMQQSSTSRRIKAVNLAYDVPEVDSEIVDNLEYLLNRDESVNVRLTALEALSKFAASSNKAKQVLIGAMRYQNKPIVQIGLIQALIELQDEEVLPVLEDLIEDQEVLEIVKDEAHFGKFKLEKF